MELSYPLKEPKNFQKSKSLKKFQKTIVHEYNFEGVMKVLQEIEGLDSDLNGYWDEHFNFDPDTLEREGLMSVPYISFMEEIKDSKVYSCGSFPVSIKGDILKQITVKGKGFTGYTVLIGNKEILRKKVNKCDKIDIAFGKIGIIMLRLRFHQVSIKMDDGTIESVDYYNVMLPTETRNKIARRDCWEDDSIPGTLFYMDGMGGILGHHQLLTTEECFDVRRIIDSMKKDEKVWLQNVPEITKLIKQRLLEKGINETISGDKVTLGCYSRGDTLHRHADNPLQGGSKSLLIYLNYTRGGETVFYNKDGTVNIKESPYTGKHVIFGIDEEHEMLELISEKKYIIACELI